MGRPQKQTADWFPHYVGGSRKTLFVLENRWGNDGYSFWFKLLELLCRSDGHYYDCSRRVNMEYLTATTHLQKDQVIEMINMLVDLEKIDRDLWESSKIIWYQSLVDNLQSLYAKRTVSVPHKPAVEDFLPLKTGESGVTETEMQTEEKSAEESVKEPEPAEEPAEEKPVKKIRRKRQSCLTAKQKELFDRFYSQYPKKVDPAAAEKAWAKIEPEPDEAMTEKIIQAVIDAQNYDSRFRERQFTPNPASWLNAKGYLSEYTQEVKSNVRYSERQQSETTAFQPSGGFRGNG